MDIVEKDELFQKKPRIEISTKLFIRQLNYISEGDTALSDNAIKIDAIFVRSAAADCVRLCCRDTPGEERSWTPSYSVNASCTGNGYLRNGHFNTVDQHGEFGWIIHKRGDRGLLKFAADAPKQPRANVSIGEEIEVDRYTVANLKGERCAARKIKDREMGE